MTPKASTTTAPVVRQATLAVYTGFIVSGFSFASWASRIPQVRDALSLSPSLGLLPQWSSSVSDTPAGRR